MRILRITAVLMLVITLLSPACYASEPDSEPVTIDNYDEYKAFVKEHRDELPEKFVHFHSVSALGEFGGFMELPSIGFDKPHTMFSNYRYIIFDKNGFEILLDIYNAGHASPDNFIDLKSCDSHPIKQQTDLRTNTSHEHPILETNDCYYSYSYTGQTLQCIVWESRDIGFKLTFDQAVIDGTAKTEQSTLATRLLDPDTAWFAVGRLKRMAYRNLNYEYPWMLPSIIGLTAFITVSAVIVNIRYPIKKKTTSPDDPPKANETPR